MKYAEDFRRIARNALSGRWGIAVLAGLLAALLGATASYGPEIKLNINDSGAHVGMELHGQPVFTFGEGWSQELGAILTGAAAILVVTALVMAAAYFILGSVVGVGYARFNLDLVDREKEPELGTLFGYFRFWKTTAAASFLQGLYVFLWSLLLIIPGIIAGYSYAMTEFILSEHPHLTASEAIAQSKQLMAGNRFRLFCLEFSFIGWDILCAFTLGIGNLWLSPYKQAARAAFYRDISDTERIVETPQAL